MAFARSVKQVLPSFGSPTTSVQRTNVALTTGSLNVNLPASGNLSPTISFGRVRVKQTTNAVGTNASCNIQSIWGTDGINTVRLYGGDASLAGNGVLIDESVDFVCDYNLTQIIVAINTANNGSNYDIEVAGNG